MNYIETEAAFRVSVFPGVGQKPGREGLLLEFKKEFDGTRECALDIAAMANAEGGTILYGVDEDTGLDGFDVAKCIVTPFDADDAVARIEQSITEWIRCIDRRPRPRILVPEPGKPVVSVPIRPSARLVAVRAEKKKKEGLVYLERDTYKKDNYMLAEEVERRIHGYTARAQRLRLIEMLGGMDKEEPVNLFYVRPPKHPHDVSTALWKGLPVLLSKPDAWSIQLGFQRVSVNKTPALFKLPYEWVATAWWDMMPKNTQRIAIFVRAFFGWDDAAALDRIVAYPIP